MTGSVHGEILRGSDRSPVGGAVIRVAQATDAREERNDAPAGSGEERLQRHLKADGEGWFAVDHLPEGEWIVEVEGRGGELIGQQETPVFDDAVTFVAVEVDPTAAPYEIIDRFASIRGTVVTAAAGAPVEGASVTIAADGGPDIAALTDQNGTFAFDGLPPGTWIVLASSLEGIGQTTVHLVAGTTVAVLVEVRATGHLP